jgi:hypothetical protein
MPHVIFGFVNDETGNPVAAAEIVLRNQRAGSKMIVSTNNQGQYQADLNSIDGGYQVGDVI